MITIKSGIKFRPMKTKSVLNSVRNIEEVRFKTAYAGTSQNYRLRGEHGVCVLLLII